jgi:hypothetical protein
MNCFDAPLTAGRLGFKAASGYSVLKLTIKSQPWSVKWLTIFRVSGGIPDG